MRKWKRYTPAFRAEALKRLKGCDNIGALARELKVSRGILYQWRDKQGGTFRKKRPGPVVDTPAIAALKKQLVELKWPWRIRRCRQIFQGCLAKHRGSAPQERKQWRSGIYEYIQKVMPSLQGKLNVERMCLLAEVSRVGFYRWLEKNEPAAEEIAVRAAIQEIAVEHHRHYGYRRITAALRQRGMVANRKRVLRMMQEDNLLAIRTRKFAVTTDSRHPFEVYLNLAQRMELTAPNQLWVADLTYIRLAQEFVYLAVVLDAFSRRVVGWAFNRSLRSTVAVDALQQALNERKPRAGLVHHSDRGVQYASEDYITLLRNHGATCSETVRTEDTDKEVDDRLQL